MKHKMVAVIVFLFIGFIIAGCGRSEEQKTQEPEEMKTESHLVRSYDVDVASLDENGNGMVFQCPMDWNVISDDPGECPLCLMNLREYSVEEAQKNLETHKD